MKTVIASILLVVCVYETAAYKCYVCESSTTSDCGDANFNPASLNTCQGGACGKERWENADGTEQRVSRSCITAGSISNTCTSTTASGTTITTCYCVGDNCNSSGHVTVSAILMTSAVLASLFLRL